MGQLLNVIWAERCPAEVLIEKDGKQKYKPCNKLAKVDRWCEEHGYKAEIMRRAESRAFPACSVNPHLTIGEGWEDWWAFTLVAPVEWYQQLRPVLRQMEYEKKPHYLNPTHASWKQEAITARDTLGIQIVFNETRAREKPDHECYRCGCLEWEYIADLSNWFCVERRDHANPGQKR